MGLSRYCSPSGVDMDNAVMRKRIEFQLRRVGGNTNRLMSAVAETNSADYTYGIHCIIAGFSHADRVTNRPSLK